MNEFIRLRELNSNYQKQYDFTEVFIENYMNKEKHLTNDEELFKSQMKFIQSIKNNHETNEETLKVLLSYLGDNPYINRYVVGMITQQFESFPKEKLETIIHEEFSISRDYEHKLYHLLDLILEEHLDILSVEDVSNLLVKYKLDLDITSLLIELIDQFKLPVSKDFLFELLKADYPHTIKLQILNTLDSRYSVKNLNINQIKKHIITDENNVFVSDYINFLTGQYYRKQSGLVLLQSMFYGDFEDSGKGNNGSLAILLKSLGNEISKDNRIDCVITITISDRVDKPFIFNYEKNHLFVRLPAYLNRNTDEPFLKRELFIKRYINNFLIKMRIEPDIFHIRYLDNASMAVAKLSKELEKKLVLTLAPDPHRNMVDEEGKLKELSNKAVKLLYNKIKIGDRLICMSDKVLGIGGKKVNKELLSYFPQFNYYDIEDKIKMIAEGIKIDKNILENSADNKVCELKDLIGIHESFCDKPIILNVGRLAHLKGQVALFKAWSNSKLFQSHNLLIIGGDLEKPSKEEGVVIDFFEKAIKDNPDLKKSFFHKGAMPNEKIQLIEQSIIKKSFELPHVYLASSIKEEFGIAILEAMSQGFLILGPIKGGVKSYVNNRENGFLIDTSSYKTIAKDTEEILYNSEIDREEFNKIQKSGQDMVKRDFSIDKISKNFCRYVLRN